LDAWSRSLDSSGDCCKEFPSSLTAYERLVVHQWAEQHAFQHCSTGEKPNRKIVVKRIIVDVDPQHKSKENVN